MSTKKTGIEEPKPFAKFFSNYVKNIENDKITFATNEGDVTTETFELVDSARSFISWDNIGILFIDAKLKTISSQRMWVNNVIKEHIKESRYPGQAMLDAIKTRDAFKKMYNPRFLFIRKPMTVVDPKSKSVYSVNVIVVSSKDETQK